MAEHRTYFIPLKENWNNRTLNASSIGSEASGLSAQALFVDEERKTIYSFGGELSADGNVEDTQANSFWHDRLPEIWALPLTNPKASRTWYQAVGKNAGTKMPQMFQQLARGTYAYDHERAYYIGGHISHWTTFEISNITQMFSVSGLVTFDFTTQQLTNSTKNDGHFFASRFTGRDERYYKPGPMFNVPFGPESTTVSFGGLTFPNATDNEYGAGWSNVWIFDKVKNTSYYQPTTGDIPKLGTSPDDITCFSAIDEVHKTFEMFVLLPNDTLSSHSANN
jgi:hypothetical protein